jgi:DinB superfamily
MTPPPDYVRDTLELLGDQDPITVLRETPDWLKAHLSQLTAEQWRRPEGEKKWSLLDVVAHMADTEIAYGWRARQVITANNPPIHGFDQGAWLERFDYAGADPAMALDTFLTLRRWNLRVWHCVSPTDLQRTGVHEVRGPETLERQQRLTAGHDLRHRRQISRILEVVR